MAFGEILKIIGDFGLFQKLILLGLAFPNFILPLYFCSFLFVETDPERHCNTDWILRADGKLSPGEQLNLTVPREQDGSFSRCRMFAPVDWNISDIREYGLNETTECQGGWVYQSSLYTSTIVTDFDLVCDKSNMAGVTQTIIMAGFLAGSFIFGAPAESYGRLRTTQIPTVLMLLFVIVSAVSPNLYIYLVAQFIIGSAIGGYRINATVLGTEWIGVTKRSFATCVGQMFACLGQCAMAGIVYFIRDWRITQFVIAGLQAVVFIYIWFIPESARWLLERGRTEEAKTLIRKVAEINKKKISEASLSEVKDVGPIQKRRIRALFNSRILMKYLVIICFAWFSLNLGYFCLTLNVGKFGLSIFVVQLLFGACETPAHLLCILFLEVIGRKLSLILTLLAAGLVCLLTLAFPQENAVAITALVTAGKFFLNWGGSVCMVYIQELFPTSVRQTAVGLGSISFRVAGLLSPAVNMLAVYHRSAPIIIFSSLSIVSGAVVVLLPETRRKELPDNTTEAEGARNTKKMENSCHLAHLYVPKSTKL